MGPRSKPRRFILNKWGMASLLLLVGDYLFWSYSFHREDLGHPLFSRFAGLAQCALVQLAATACGIVALRSGSKWWAVTVLLAAWLAVTCYFGEL